MAGLGGGPQHQGHSQHAEKEADAPQYVFRDSFCSNLILSFHRSTSLIKVRLTLLLSLFFTML